MRFLLTLSAFLCCLANAQDTATVIKPFGSKQANASPATSVPAVSVPVKTQTPVAAADSTGGNAAASISPSTTIQAAPDRTKSPDADGLDKTPNSGVRLKDLVSIEGVRTNQLIGYGLVVGLNGTGDRQQTLFSAQSLTNLLQRMGVSVSPTTITVKNTAAVLVTATLPPFAQPGTTIDATVSAIGDANNLQGGILVLTTLRAINGQVYASAQGPVVTGGFAVGRTQNSATVNHPTVGRIPNGISVERPAPSQAIGNVIRLQLKEADFTTAARVAAAVNRHFASREPVAHAENSALVSVNLPAQYSTHATEFISELERLSAEPDRIARVVVNERTGTVVLGKDVRSTCCRDARQSHRRDPNSLHGGTAWRIFFRAARGRSANYCRG